MRLLIAGGGTGGHIYPGVAVAQAWLQHPGNQVRFAGTTRGLERELVPQAGFELALINAAPLAGRTPVKLASTGLATLAGLWQSWRLVRTYRPEVVLGTGGYVCAPVVLAAHMAQIPIVLQEQNALPGKTNRLLARLAKQVALGYPEAAVHFPQNTRKKLLVTGNPIREELLVKIAPAQARTALGLEPERKTVLIFGASQGAKRINDAVMEMAPVWAQGQIQYLWQTGQRNFADVARQLEIQARAANASLVQGDDGLSWGCLHLRPYLYDMAKAYQAADLVVGRAGAISLAEITALGLPALLIPYPFAAENHQEFNARALAAQGAAEVLLDHEVTGAVLDRRITTLLQDESKLASMARQSASLGRPQATQTLVTVLARLAAGSN